MKCPQCGKDLGKESEIYLNIIGWSCIKCGIKIYKEKKQ